MKSGGALLLVFVGLLALWIVITGRLPGLQAAWATLAQNSATGATPASGGATSSSDLSSSISPQTTAAPVYVVPTQFAAAAPIQTPTVKKAPVSNVRVGGGGV